MEKLNKLNFASQAEDVIKGMIKTNRKGEEFIKLTTSKVRNMLTMTNTLYNDLLKNRSDVLDEDLRSNIQYLKMKFAYEAGRDDDVKDFVRRAGLIQAIDRIGDSRDNALLFCRYMESLVAYHRFYGGKER